MMGLGRRQPERQTPIEEVEAAISKERAESGSNIGYRLMHQRLTQKYKMQVGRDVVMMLSAVTDPIGVGERKKHKLKRRVYQNKGPDFLWHIDGYDKLKPFSFPIHGCIDGYSRRIHWLHVATTNNDPFVIAGYYLECVRNIGGCPTVLRADRGTENTNVAFLQPFLRHGDETDDAFAGEKSFMYGRSTSNQRIEAWWGQLRKNAADWWIKYFKGLRDEGEFNDSNAVHIDCIRFCFTDLIQKELAEVAHEWNTHRIRPNSTNPGGVPDMLYFLPELEDTQSYKCQVTDDDLEAAMEYSSSKPLTVPQEFIDIATVIMEEDRIKKPETIQEAESLYKQLKNAIE